MMLSTGPASSSTPTGRIDPGGRLVEQQDARPGRNRKPHVEQALPAIGQRGRLRALDAGEPEKGNQLWLIAANRNSTFAPALLVTSDATTWHEESAPWSPRGAPAVWIFDDKLFMAGGKYSMMENGTPRFIYRNDVWSMARTTH